MYPVTVCKAPTFAASLELKTCPITRGKGMKVLLIASALTLSLSLSGCVGYWHHHDDDRRDSGPRRDNSYYDHGSQRDNGHSQYNNDRSRYDNGRYGPGPQHDNGYSCPPGRNC